MKLPIIVALAVLSATGVATPAQAQKLVRNLAFHIDACTFDNSFGIDIVHGRAYECRLQRDSGDLTYYLVKNGLRCNAEGPGPFPDNECRGVSRVPDETGQVLTGEFLLCKTTLITPKRDNAGAGWTVSGASGKLTVVNWVTSKTTGQFSGGSEILAYWTHTIIRAADREALAGPLACDFASQGHVGLCYPGQESAWCK